MKDCNTSDVRICAARSSVHKEDHLRSLKKKARNRHRVKPAVFLRLTLLGNTHLEDPSPACSSASSVVQRYMRPSRRMRRSWMMSSSCTRHMSIASYWSPNGSAGMSPRSLSGARTAGSVTA